MGICWFVWMGECECLLLDWVFVICFNGRVFDVCLDGCLLGLGDMGKNSYICIFWPICDIRYLSWYFRYYSSFRFDYEF